MKTWRENHCSVSYGEEGIIITGEKHFQWLTYITIIILTTGGHVKREPSFNRVGASVEEFKLGQSSTSTLGRRLNNANILHEQFFPKFTPKDRESQQVDPN